MTQSPHDVFIVDDDPSVLRAISRILSSAGYRTHTFNSPLDFVESLNGKSTEPGCVVLDMHMPELNGLDVQRHLNDKKGVLSVVFLTAHGQIDQCVEALKSGAADFLTKPVTDTRLLDSVSAAIQKSEVRFKKLTDLKVLRKRTLTLSPRELEVFSLVVTGLMNKQIASILGTSEKTVKVQRSRVTEKMNASSFAELVVMAGKLGLKRSKPDQVPEPAEGLS
jgi:FixJ family two-component response regulator